MGQAQNLATGRDVILKFCHRTDRAGILTACSVLFLNVLRQPQERRDEEGKKLTLDNFLLPITEWFCSRDIPEQRSLSRARRKYTKEKE